LDREIGNLVRAIATAAISPALQARMAIAERERADLCRGVFRRAPSINRVTIVDPGLFYEVGLSACRP
jgi:hypothetical protein